MTKVLKMSLMGQLQLSLDERPLTELVSGKAQALLCYLAVDGRSHSRQTLSGLLWGELPEEDARRNLRGVLMKLRELLHPHLHITHQAIAFNNHSLHWLDVTTFRAQTNHRPGSLPTLTQLREAVALYRGEFLEDFYVRQAPLFEEWVVRLRRELHEVALQACHQLTVVYSQQGEDTLGMEYARRLLEIDPLYEEGHRQLMWLLAQSGNRSSALGQYELCRELLLTELAVQPASETVSLYEQIRDGKVPPREPTRKIVVGKGSERVLEPPETAVSPSYDEPPSFIVGPPIVHPARFFGRERELKRLFGLLRQVPLQNSAIIGPRRSGKTSLLHYLKTITTAPAHQLRPQQKTDWLPANGRYRWVFVDFQDPRLGGSEGLLRYLLSQLGLPVPPTCTLDYFLDVVSDSLNRPTVILFDEIGVALQRYPELDDTFWESLRSLATNQVGGNLAFVLAGSESPEQLASHRGFGSPFFNIFGYTATLGPLSETEAHDLITSSPIPFAPEDVAWMIAESGRWPMLLQILCRERLLSLEDGETGPVWRSDALQQMMPFKRGFTE